MYFFLTKQILAGRILWDIALQDLDFFIYCYFWKFIFACSVKQNY